MAQKIRLPVIREKKARHRSSRRLLLLLLVFFIILLIILFFNSSLSKIAAIDIKGNQFLTVEEIGQASQVKLDDHFFAVRAKTIEQRIKALEFVKSVEVTKKFPGHISMHVTEYAKVAFQISEDGLKEVILANGSIVQVPNQEIVVDKPILTGWAADDPIKGKLSQVLGTIPPEKLADISEIKPNPSTSYPDKIKLYTRSYFEVITTVQYLAEKMSYLDDIIYKLKKQDITAGKLTLLEADIHTSFKEENKEEEGQEKRDY